MNVIKDELNFRLLAIAGPVTGNTFAVAPELTVGKDADNMLCIVDKTLSTHHFKVVVEDRKLILYDGNSTNGTWVDAKFHSRLELQHGDRIEAGTSVFIALINPDVLDAFAKLKDEIDQEQWRIQKQATFRIERSARQEAAIYYKDVIKGFSKMAAAVNAISNTDELLELLLDLTFQIIPAYKAAILLNGRRLSPDAADLIGQVYREPHPAENAPPFRLSSMSTAALQAVYRDRAPHMAIHPVAVMCLPLLMDGTMIGVIYVEGTDARTGFDPEHLQFLATIAEFVVSAVSKANEFQQLRRQCAALKAERQATDPIVGESEAILSVLELADAAAASDVPVLILGETGAGKESLARRIHEHSERSDKCYLTVNCPAVAESLFESEYFGHEKGSFTGATEAREGKFQMADGGTLFLDEIGELGVSMQPKLLRALQQGEVQRVGGKPVKVDVRIVAATNVDLQKAIREGKFRQDLFYRLKGIIIRVPSLRERRGDIPLLVKHFIKKDTQKTGVTAIDEDALAAIRRYDWPGNVRELEQVIECGMVLAKAARQKTIALVHLPVEVVQPAEAKPVTLKEQVDKLADETRRAAARAMLAECEGDQQRAADNLGISKRYLQYLLGK